MVISHIHTRTHARTHTHARTRTHTHARTHTYITFKSVQRSLSVYPSFSSNENAQNSNYLDMLFDFMYKLEAKYNRLYHNIEKHIQIPTRERDDEILYISYM